LCNEQDDVEARASGEHVCRGLAGGADEISAFEQLGVSQRYREEDAVPRESDRNLKSVANLSKSKQNSRKNNLKILQLLK